MWKLLARSVLCFVSLLAIGASSVFAQSLAVYTDSLQNSFENWSYGGGTNLANGTTVRTGTMSIAFDGNNFNAVSLAHPSGAFTTAAYPVIHFWVHGGTSGGQLIRLNLYNGETVVANQAITAYVDGGGIAAGTWREVTIDLRTALAYNGSYTRFDLQCDVAGTQNTLYFDDIELLATAPSAPVSDLEIEHGVTVASMFCDRFTWIDSAGKERVAVLAHNDGQVGPGGGRGGSLREFRYQLPNGSTRIAGLTGYGIGDAGFGYVVSHASRYIGCVGGDSPIGGMQPGDGFVRVFEGKHHAIFRFKQKYPRNCTASGSVIARTIPVTIDWTFSTGRDNPVWSITYDVDQLAAVSDGTIAPVNTIHDDSRAPYGELAIDGVGAVSIDGTSWGDRYRFTSTTSPLTLNSSWTWNQTNTVPFVKVWIDGPLQNDNTRDATMGIVQTQTMTQQDAAGGRDPGVGSDIRPYWNTTSAAGNACATKVMPCPNDWPYQANANSVEFSFPNASNNARLSWKTQYGFLGQQTYPVNDGVVTSAPGYPKKSYSTYIVLGPHTSGPVETQRTEVETVQTLTLTATVGSVVTSGPAGVTRADNVTYSPPGYNHVYGALAFNASNNNLDANIAVGAGSLKNPLIIISGYSGGTPVVKLGDVTLTADVDYYASLRATASELWITLNRTLTGAVNNLEIVGTANNTPTINASGPTTFCAGGSVTLTASTAPAAGVSYLWSPGGQTTQAIVVTTSGSYSVTVTVNGNPGTSAPTLVTVHPLPATPTISARGVVDPYRIGLTGAAASHAGSTYLWSITNGSITGGQGTAQITYSSADQGTLVLSVIETDSNGCSSAQSAKTVLVYPRTVGARSDFNFNGTEDILWRNPTSGGNALWQMHGFQIAEGYYLGATHTYLDIAGAGDFNGDGRADILWRDDTGGNNAIWLMQSFVRLDGRFLPTVDPSLVIVGIGDIDADGRADILWRNQETGFNAAWLMDGTSVKQGIVLPSAASSFLVAGFADLNGDGRADIVFRNPASGDNAVWLMNGADIIAGAFLPNVGSSLQIVGLGDLNADGRSDIVWRNRATGVNAAWLMNGTLVAQGAFLPDVSTAMHLAGVGDLNGDSRSDLLWRDDSNGTNAVWLMNGVFVSAGAFIETAPPPWSAVAPK